MYNYPSNWCNYNFPIAFSSRAVHFIFMSICICPCLFQPQYIKKPEMSYGMYMFSSLCTSYIISATCLIKQVVNNSQLVLHISLKSSFHVKFWDTAFPPLQNELMYNFENKSIHRPQPDMPGAMVELLPHWHQQHSNCMAAALCYHPHFYWIYLLQFQTKNSVRMKTNCVCSSLFFLFSLMSFMLLHIFH